MFALSPQVYDNFLVIGRCLEDLDAAFLDDPEKLTGRSVLLKNRFSKMLNVNT